MVLYDEFKNDEDALDKIQVKDKPKKLTEAEKA